MRRKSLVALAAVAAVAAIAFAACGKSSKKGPVVAKGSGITITADEFKARLDEQSPFIRARYTTLDRKKEFLDNLIRFEVLAHAAEQQGLDRDPDVQLTLKKVMVQRLVQKKFQDANGAKDIPEPELRKYYDEHKDDYVKPKRVRANGILLRAEVTDARRASRAAEAKKLLASAREEEKKNAFAFAKLARERSDDEGTKRGDGDLGFKSHDEYERQYGKAVADAVFAAKDGEITPVIEAPQGYWILKVTGHQDELDRQFDLVKSQIAARLYREKKMKEFDEWVKRLRADANVTVNEAELDKVQVASAPAAIGGMPPGHGGFPVMPRPNVAATPNAPAATASPAPAGHK